MSVYQKAKDWFTGSGPILLMLKLVLAPVAVHVLTWADVSFMEPLGHWGRKATFWMYICALIGCALHLMQAKNLTLTRRRRRFGVGVVTLFLSTGIYWLVSDLLPNETWVLPFDIATVLSFSVSYVSLGFVLSQVWEVFHFRASNAV